jgi:DNA-binding response OmpR family regulator
MDSRVMIVDDNPYIRESVEILLQLNGTKALNASGGEECLKHLDAGFRGVILMDIMMPFMDGWDTIREMVARGLNDGNLIIMLTAMNEPTSKMHGLQEYVADYITKPFTPHEFLDKLRFYLSLLDGACAHEG